MKTTDKIYDQHRENTDALEKLSFYKDEITVMQSRIEEVAKSNSSKDVLAEVEHFQNQLIVQKNNIDMIRHDVNENERMLEDNVNKNKIATDHRTVKDHSTERKEVDAFEKNFNELRQELNKFLTKWM